MLFKGHLEYRNFQELLTPNYLNVLEGLTQLQGWEVLRRVLGLRSWVLGLSKIGWLLCIIVDCDMAF